MFSNRAKCSMIRSSSSRDDDLGNEGFGAVFASLCPIIVPVLPRFLVLSYWCRSVVPVGSTAELA